MSWNLKQLEELFQQQDSWTAQAENECLYITNEDGLDAYIAISGDQILAETILFERSQVSDTTGLNEEILKTHQYFPLSTIAISQINGLEYYVAFGALSSQSKAESVVIELETLFQNVSGFLDTYETFLK